MPRPTSTTHPAPPPCSPGPVTANPASSMGRQILSTRSSGACLGFGTGKRLVEHATDVPGPGEHAAGMGWAFREMSSTDGMALW